MGRTAAARNISGEGKALPPALQGHLPRRGRQGADSDNFLTNCPQIQQTFPKTMHSVENTYNLYAFRHNVKISQKFYKMPKHLQHRETCAIIHLGCGRLVQNKQAAQAAICVDGEVAAVKPKGWRVFRGVCPILEPGERITETKGYVRACILRGGPMFTLLCNDSFRENCANTVHRILSCERLNTRKRV